jgi:hypothetical protein
MKFLPLKTTATLGVQKIQQISGLELKNHFLISKYSTIYLYKIEDLKLKKKTPILHNKFLIGSVIMVKNRIFVTINCTLHILDFYIPLTRIKIFSKPISNILRFKNIIFLFSKEEQIGLTIDIWTLKSLKSLKKVSEKFSLFETSVAIRKNFILFFTIEGILEIWNIETLKKICSLNLKLIFNSKNFFFIDCNEAIVANFQKNKVFIFSLCKKFTSIILKHKKLKKLEKISFLKKNSSSFLFKSEKNLYLISKKKILDKLNLKCHQGNIQSADLINYRFLLTTGSFDNTIAIHYFNQNKLNFNFIVKKSGRNNPLRQIHLLQFNRIFSKIESQFLKIEKIKTVKIKKINKYHNLSVKNLIKIKTKNKSKFNHGISKLKQIIIKTNPVYLERYKILILFFRNSTIWSWDSTINNFDIRFPKSIKIENNFNYVCSIGISCKLNILIISFENNLISFFDIINQKFLFYGKNHNFYDFSFNCRIKFSELDPSETLFLSFCSHGILNLWDLITLRIQKTLILKGLSFLRWSTLRDLISISTVDFKIYLCIPQDLYTIRVFMGHFGKINGLFFINNDRYLLSFSTDKTLKIWDLFENVCCDQIRFNFYPLSIWNNHETSSVFISHENTIGLSVWTYFSIKTTFIDNFSTIKIFKCNEINFSFFETYETLSPETSFKWNRSKKSSLFNLICKIGPINSFSKKEKLIKTEKENRNKFLKTKKLKNHPHNFFHLYLKKLKKINIEKIKYLNSKIEQKEFGGGNIENFILKFSREFYLFSFLTIESLIENMLWINLGFRLKSINLHILENIFVFIKGNFLYFKHLVDIIYL